MASLKQLLDLQHVDTALHQLQHRLTTLPERAALAAALVARDRIKKESLNISSQQKNAQRDIDLLEASNKQFESAIVKYAQQLKTIIAPREAEALQHEIAMASAERSANDDRELVLLETAEQFDRQLAELTFQIAVQATAIENANLALGLVIAECEALRIDLEAKRTGCADAVDPQLLSLYNLKRDKRNATVVADLHGVTCQSCHLDLSPVELSALKKLPTTELPECPNCDCLLAI